MRNARWSFPSPPTRGPLQSPAPGLPRRRRHGYVSEKGQTNPGKQRQAKARLSSTAAFSATNKKLQPGAPPGPASYIARVNNIPFTSAGRTKAPDPSGGDGQGVPGNRHRRARHRPEVPRHDVRAALTERLPFRRGLRSSPQHRRPVRQVYGREVRSRACQSATGLPTTWTPPGSSNWLIICDEEYGRADGAKGCLLPPLSIAPDYQSTHPPARSPAQLLALEKPASTRPDNLPSFLEGHGRRVAPHPDDPWSQ